MSERLQNQREPSPLRGKRLRAGLLALVLPLAACSHDSNSTPLTSKDTLPPSSPTLPRTAPQLRNTESVPQWGDIETAVPVNCTQWSFDERYMGFGKDAPKQVFFGQMGSSVLVRKTGWLVDFNSQNYSFKLFETTGGITKQPYINQLDTRLVAEVTKPKIRQEHHYYLGNMAISLQQVDRLPDPKDYAGGRYGFEDTDPGLYVKVTVDCEHNATTTLSTSSPA